MGGPHPFSSAPCFKCQASKFYVRLPQTVQVLFLTNICLEVFYSELRTSKVPVFLKALTELATL